ncbi:CBASS cGAMP-activated phospholipase [Tardiphaga robiniae]|uniref:Patatin-like phospholipase family protein n=1 Tax=Tardiphaga robiniae TaxID=943830 RepID=A0A7G6TXA7_9BRAD|nr:CBASS cGAMP-activated phospholipase [Tardiphaga robiniae]QND71389.1 patatin-like phospholipase family protein [Tardiphaga robiniae]
MSETARDFRPGDPRSKGAIPQRRIPQDWPKDRRFRILSLDGGGIKGLFPATVLAELERRYLGGASIAGYFDLVAGTSTGGIIALGLGAGLTAAEMADLYLTRGPEVFPQPSDTAWGRPLSWWRGTRSYVLYNYERGPLESLLTGALGDKLLGDSTVRLCIPAFEGKHSEVFVFKTPHHCDYKFDRLEPMVKAALATAAAPTYFRPLEHNGYKLVDGGVWANNPVMLAVIEAMICFDLDRDQIDVLTLGCGDDPYVVSPLQSALGGKLTWYDLIFAAMRLQSLAATNQARLLLGPPAIRRIDPPATPKPIKLDDFRRSRDELVPAACKAVDEHGDALAAAFLGSRADPYEPVPFPAA